jgi:hypothetical protein
MGGTEAILKVLLSNFGSLSGKAGGFPDDINS